MTQWQWVAKAKNGVSLSNGRTPWRELLSKNYHVLAGDDDFGVSDLELSFTGKDFVANLKTFADFMFNEVMLTDGKDTYIQHTHNHEVTTLTKVLNGSSTRGQLKLYQTPYASSQEHTGIMNMLGHAFHTMP